MASQPVALGAGSLEEQGAGSREEQAVAPASSWARPATRTAAIPSSAAQASVAAFQAASHRVSRILTAVQETAILVICAVSAHGSSDCKPSGRDGPRRSGRQDGGVRVRTECAFHCTPIPPRGRHWAPWLSNPWFQTLVVGCAAAMGQQRLVQRLETGGLLREGDAPIAGNESVEHTALRRNHRRDFWRDCPKMPTTRPPDERLLPPGPFCKKVPRIDSWSRPRPLRGCQW